MGQIIHIVRSPNSDTKEPSDIKRPGEVRASTLIFDHLYYHYSYTYKNDNLSTYPFANPSHSSSTLFFKQLLSILREILPYQLGMITLDDDIITSARSLDSTNIQYYKGTFFANNNNNNKNNN